jgi:mRNA deadenylase 3'-5' endonuclease subunit Ccr4
MMMQNCLIWKFQLNFSVIIETAELSKNEYIQNEELSENTQYYWRVGPKNECGNGDFSLISSFTTGSNTSS